MRIKVLILFLLAFGGTQASFCNSAEGKNAITLEKQVVSLQNQQIRTENNIRKLQDAVKSQSNKAASLDRTVSNQKQQIDSLRAECARLAQVQNADRNTLTGKLATTNNVVASNQSMVENRTLWGGIVALVLVLLSLGIAYALWKRIKNGTSSIDEVRKAQEALQAAQAKMQEESVKLDNKLIDLAEKQLATVPATTSGNKEPDHSLAKKVADEIVRIELNMSRMDSSVKGYKQLAKAVQRIKDNFQANGYEIVDMLGKPYNEGMKVVANFVVDENLAEGQQIITGITKPQINYNGQMIQAAQITVSQNI